MGLGLIAEGGLRTGKGGSRSSALVTRDLFCYFCFFIEHAIGVKSRARGIFQLLNVVAGEILALVARYVVVSMD